MYVLDKRKSFQIVKKLIGNRGSIRALATVGSPASGEYVVTGGCDRHVRLFDPLCDMQKNSEVAHVYVKQKVNSILVGLQ